MALAARSERQLLQAPRSAKARRRRPEQAQLAVDEAVRCILADPPSGVPKVGALKGVRVVMFKVGPQPLLLA
ncbi:MAG: type II toxin-antitoxin system RelE/ParE family toxin [Nitrospiraceae bacterium]